MQYLLGLVLSQLATNNRLVRVMFVMECLVGLMLIESARVWWRVAKRCREGEPVLACNENRRTQWATLPELCVVYIGLLLVLSSLLSRLLKPDSSEQVLPSLNAIALQAVICFGLSLVLPLVMVAGSGSWSAIGMSIKNLPEQLRDGLWGFLAAMLPMCISLVATIPFRGEENQHSLLKILLESPEGSTIALIALTATLAAPLFEELVYRVILQGWLSTLLPSAVVIPAVALLFSMVHGWRDGLALLPLALVLGYVFDRRHSYLSVVVIHALFNSTMLILQLLNPRI